MQNVFGGDGLLADPALGKGHVLGDILVEVVADHQHIQIRVVEYQRVGDYQVQRLFLARAALLPHAVAQHFAAAELALLAVHGVILFDLDDQVRVAQPHPVAGGGTVHIRISASIHTHS